MVTVRRAVCGLGPGDEGSVHLRRDGHTPVVASVAGEESSGLRRPAMTSAVDGAFYASVWDGTGKG